MKTLKHLITALSIGGILLSCSSSQQSTSTDANQPRTTENYTSSFPQRDVSDQLQRIQKSILRIVTTGFYENYTFDKQYITHNDINTNDLNDIASEVYSSEGSTAGTSIILDHRKEKSLLLTCEHVISFPDTLIDYYEGDDIPENTFIKSISIKQDQSNVIHTDPNLRSFEIIASDVRLDLALIRIDHPKNPLESSDIFTNISPLRIEAGNSDRLRLGSFLYILGFPKGYSMITRGLASSSKSLKDRFFVSDALFNPGISGGLILATNNNFKSFQWVGVASSSSAKRENILVPRPASNKYSKARFPYKDSVFVQQKTRINYGITQAIPINKVRDFLDEYQSLISEEGFYLSSGLNSE